MGIRPQVQTAPSDGSGEFWTISVGGVRARAIDCRVGSRLYLAVDINEDEKELRPCVHSSTRGNRSSARNGD